MFKNFENNMSEKKLSVEQELEKMQHDTFKYFLHETNLRNGLVIDKTAPNWPASIAATGLGLACYPVGVERGFMSREAAAGLTLNTLQFFWNSHQGPEVDATGYKGLYYHFLDMENGQRAWQSELSTVDSAFLLAGMLTAAQYFDANNVTEQEIRRLADELYRRADWQWAQNDGDTITHGWKPETGFLPYRWEGYDEALLLYMLALGSPTYPISSAAYSAWASTYEWKNCYGYDYLYAGPLFTHQLSHAWIDFRKIQDEVMRSKNMDYFENSRRATYVQQRYAIENPLGFAGYRDCCWGITASDGPGPDIRKIQGVERHFYDYIGRGVPFGPDDGTVAPWAAVTSLPFAPEIVLPVIDHYIYNLRLKEGHLYGFRATFNQTHPDQCHPCGWVSPWHYGLNEGPIILMAENFRTGFLWNLMRECPYIVNGLRRAGFTGGWL
jgi:hypothetical protein